MCVQVGVDNLTARLQHIKLQYNDHEDCGSLSFRLHPPANAIRNTQVAAGLREQLAVLNAVQCIDSNGEPEHDGPNKVVLVEWLLSSEVMHELQHLPRCANVLDLSACEWWLADSAYEALARCHVPVWYTCWYLGFTEPCEAGRLESIISGIIERSRGDAMSEGSGGVTGSESEEGSLYEEQNVTVTVQSQALVKYIRGRQVAEGWAGCVYVGLHNGEMDE